MQQAQRGGRVRRHEILKDVWAVREGAGDEAHEGAREGEEGGVVALRGLLQKGRGDAGRVDVGAHEEALGLHERVRRGEGGADVEALCFFLVVDQSWGGGRWGIGRSFTGFFVSGGGGGGGGGGRLDCEGRKEEGMMVVPL